MTSLEPKLETVELRYIPTIRELAIRTLTTGTVPAAFSLSALRKGLPVPVPVLGIRNMPCDCAVVG